MQTGAAVPAHDAILTTHHLLTDGDRTMRCWQPWANAVYGSNTMNADGVTHPGLSMPVSFTWNSSNAAGTPKISQAGLLGARQSRKLRFV
mmetsp:Transcript_98079/g.316273  ORF Transcript_98079/g.316273 Transcript_98079/m.316273 type:complete len:90 (-) Transcript_98079:2745-3014(-)